MLELSLVLIALGLMVAILLPALARPRSRSGPANCVSNLKQIGLAFRMWANDHGEKFPMALSATNAWEGTLDYSMTGEVWRHFQIISNELNSPKVLACRSDERSRPTDWNQITDNAHLSYFVGLDADETRPQTVLSGDRNLTSAASSTNGVLLVRSADRPKWTRALHNGTGNFGLADGSAQQLSQVALIKQFQAVFLSTTQTVHRLALPE